MAIKKNFFTNIFGEISLIRNFLQYKETKGNLIMKLKLKNISNINKKFK